MLYTRASNRVDMSNNPRLTDLSSDPCSGSTQWSSCRIITDAISHEHESIATKCGVRILRWMQHLRANVEGTWHRGGPGQIVIFTSTDV